MDYTCGLNTFDPVGVITLDYDEQIFNAIVIGCARSYDIDIGIIANQVRVRLRSTSLCSLTYHLSTDNLYELVLLGLCDIVCSPVEFNFMECEHTCNYQMIRSLTQTRLQIPGLVSMGDVNGGGKEEV